MTVEARHVVFNPLLQTPQQGLDENKFVVSITLNGSFSKQFDEEKVCRIWGNSSALGSILQIHQHVLANCRHLIGSQGEDKEIALTAEEKKRVTELNQQYGRRVAKEIHDRNEPGTSISARGFFTIGNNLSEQQAILAQVKRIIQKIEQDNESYSLSCEGKEI